MMKYPFPLKVSELKLVLKAMSFLLVLRAAPSGNTRFRPFVGVKAGVQLAAVDQLLFAPAPVAYRFYYPPTYPLTCLTVLFEE